MFDKMKSLLDMQKKMQEVKRELDNTNVEVESQNGIVKITMSASQEVRDIKIKDNANENEYNSLEQALKEAFNKAIRRSQDIAAQKMKAITGLNLPGLA